MTSRLVMSHFVVLLLAATQVYVGCASEANVAPVGVSRRLLSSSDDKAVRLAANGSTANCDNVNGTCAVSTKQPTIEDQPLWMEIFDDVQLLCTVIGFLANTLTLIVLFLNYKGFSRVILILLRHQSIADAWVCLMAAILIKQPFMWMTGFYYIDVFVCYCWHGQAFYWGGVTLSTYNLMLIALERYLAVCRPFDHGPVNMMSRRKMALLFLALYVSVVVITHGTYIQTRLTADGECVNEYAFSGTAVEVYFFGFVIFTYITTYLIPVVFMAGLYGLVIHQLNKRLKDTKLGHSCIVDRASTELTKTAIAVTIIFIISIGYDLNYYLLGYTGVTVYELGTPIQKIGVFLSNLNSVANPFVYALLMPMYRRSVYETFACCLPRRSTDITTSTASRSVPSGGTASADLSVNVSSIEINAEPGPSLKQLED